MTSSPIATIDLVNTAEAIEMVRPAKAVDRIGSIGAMKIIIATTDLIGIDGTFQL